MGSSQIHPMPHKLAPTLTTPQAEGRAVSSQGKFHTIVLPMRFSLGARRNGKASTASSEETDGDPYLSQTERTMQQTLSDREEDDEEVDALILDSPNRIKQRAGRCRYSENNGDNLAMFSGFVSVQAADNCVRFVGDCLKGGFCLSPRNSTLHGGCDGPSLRSTRDRATLA
jgi:hypothetical protein